MIVESIIYSFPYLVLILLFVILIIFENYLSLHNSLRGSNLQMVRWFSMGLILLFFGFRGFIGWDWTTYYPSFMSLPKIGELTLDSFTGERFDPGFVVLMSIIKTIWSDYHFFIFVSTLIDIIILGLFLKRFSPSLALSGLIFIIMSGFYLETDLLRNAKSIMLFILSIRYINERRIIPFYLLNLTGWLFHFSSLLYLPLYFFLHKRISRRIMVIVATIGIIVYLLQLEYIKPLVLTIAESLDGRFAAAVDAYFSLEEYSSAYGISIGFLERIGTYSLIVIFYNKLITKSENVIFINSYFLFFVIFFFFSEVKIIPVRVGGLFAFSYWILYPRLLEVISLKNNRLIFLTFILLYTSLKIISMTDNVLYRYDNVITGIQSFKERLEIFEQVKPILFK